MMFAAVPQMLIDLGILAGVFTATATAIAVLWKTPPVRWFREHISKSLGDWLKDRIVEAQDEHHRYVRHHLGPNGSSPPIHARIQALEAAIGTAPLPVVDWHEPYDDDE